MNKLSQELATLQDNKRELQATVRELKTDVENNKKACQREIKQQESKQEQVIDQCTVACNIFLFCQLITQNTPKMLS